MEKIYVVRVWYEEDYYWYDKNFVATQEEAEALVAEYESRGLPAIIKII